MTDIRLIRTPTGTFAPLDDEEAEKVRRIKTGAMVNAKLTQVRNPKFHRKLFALYKVAFDMWADLCEPQEYRGQPVKPSPERFRKDLTILCGFYKPVFAVNGEMRLEAESISFANMDEERFEALYSQTINVILTKVLHSTGLTEEKLREHVEAVLRFDS